MWGAGAPLLVALALTGCQDATHPVAAAQAAGSVAHPASSVSQARIAITPATGTTGVAPSARVAVHAGHGALTSVAVTDAGGHPLAGRFSPDRHDWTSSRVLQAAAGYAVAAEAADGADRRATARSTFRTLTPTALLSTSISPLTNTTVGVGMPVVVRLNHAVTDRAAVQRALTVTTSTPVPGSWSWLSDREVQYRPQAYWPAHTQVAVGVHLDGVHAGKGVWGDERRTVRFTIGDAVVSTVDVKKLRLTVTRGGKVVRVIPVTTGKAGFLTRGGIKVISEKWRTKVMDAATNGTSKGSPDYYRLTVQYALRVTWSGEFVHAAPWSVAHQGQANVSHGCVGMSMTDGRWFYEQSRVGDVVTVVNSSRPLEAGNGWTAWNVPWAQWQAGSAV